MLSEFEKATVEQTPSLHRPRRILSTPVEQGKNAVLVGEYSSSFLELDKFEKPGKLKKKPSDKKRKRQDSEASEATTEVRETTNDAYIVVRKVKDKQSRLYRLCNKNNGLFEILQLNADTSKKVFFYHEWVTGPKETNCGIRRQHWCASLNNFCAQYMEEHSNDFRDMSQVSKAAKEQEKESTGATGPYQSIASSIQKCLASFQAIGSKFYLDQMIARAGEAFGSSGMPKSEDMTYQQAVIQTFVKAVDKPDLKTAEEAANAYKKLWPQHEDVEAAPISAHILLRLSDGLRENALPAGVTIEESLYRAFITNFCLHHAGKMQQDVSQRDDDIRMAYRSARLTVGAERNTTPSARIDLTITKSESES
ncbi:hypothetical protein EDB81DRAFT_854382 [Dactylonectria macrodidyma]|uniref:Uncharacterized protein n=1 Tax=Dactylonectria macrodidyma TaxID=307937 RepID=A0A9P9J9Z0_9HYPO|nr:hypothetical protein EDB81DRAFT_854382 [Dactylonectria macrodidyma]